MIVRVSREHDVARARQVAKAMAEDAGLRNVAVHYVATCVSELASNLFFHAARGGTITLGSLRRGSRVGIEVVAEDDGPGIPDVGRAMRDGFTTNGGLGGGLPGAERLMDEFRIESHPAVGTRIVARKWDLPR